MQKIRKTYKILSSLFPGRREAVFSVLKHTVKVRELAVFLLEKDKVISFDKEAVEWGALLHDVGRLLNLEQAIFHGVEGAKIIAENSLFSFLAAELREKVVTITQKHVGCGIEGYIPESGEELLVSFVDNIFAGYQLRGINWCVERYSRELSPEYGKKVLEQVEKLQALGFRLEFLY